MDEAGGTLLAFIAYFNRTVADTVLLNASDLTVVLRQSRIPSQRRERSIQPDADGLGAPRPARVAGGKCGAALNGGPRC